MYVFHMVTTKSLYIAFLLYVTLLSFSSSSAAQVSTYDSMYFPTARAIEGARKAPIMYDIVQGNFIKNKITNIAFFNGLPFQPQKIVFRPDQSIASVKFFDTSFLNSTTNPVFLDINMQTFSHQAVDIDYGELHKQVTSKLYNNSANIALFTIDTKSIVAMSYLPSPYLHDAM